MAGRIQVKIVLFVIFISLLSLAEGCTSPAKTTDLFFYTTDSLKSGDIILRKSYGLISDIIVAQLNDTLDVSHCGIIVTDSSGSFMVIHSLSKKVSDVDGVQICSLEDFLNDSQLKTVRVVRYKSADSYKIAIAANDYLSRKVPFDEDFNPNDTTALYCSELPVVIIRKCFNQDVSKGFNMPKFSMFLQDNYFRKISFIECKK